MIIVYVRILFVEQKDVKKLSQGIIATDTQ